MTLSSTQMMGAGTGRAVVTWCAMAMAIALAWLVVAPAASAQFAVTGFDGQVLAEGGAAATQAGSHPHTAGARIDFAHRPVGTLGLSTPYEDVRDIVVDLPPGLVGNPTVVKQCPFGDLAETAVGCKADTQVGVAEFENALFGYQRRPLYSLVAPPGEAASFGFIFASVPIVLNARVRARGDGSYAVSLVSPDTPQAVPLMWASTTLWGVPGDSAHDVDRGGPSPLPARALVTLPTACTAAGVGLETQLAVTSWGGSSDSASFVSHDVAPNEDRQVGPSGCDLVPFEPSVDIAPTATRPDAASGLDVKLAFPQDQITDPTALATAHLKRASVTLPEGMGINPAAADGLAACSDSELGLGNDAPVSCPAASKIGTVTATSPLLGRYNDDGLVMTQGDGPVLEPIEGGVFIRSQNSGDPGSGEMFRLALVLENEARGIRVKLAGQVKADPVTGRLTTSFDNNPQLPVSDIRLSLKSGPRAPLALPATCGTKTIETELTSWAGHTVNLQDSFTVACGGGGFEPGFDAGSLNPIGGAFSPLAVLIDRPEGQQALSGVSVDLPEGLIGKLRGVELCPDAVAGDGTPGVCPAGSRIGTATVAAGSGAPFHLQGPVYLTGPYKGHPYGLSVQVPAKAGPFDLGMVKVRQAIAVDPETARLSVASDPLPQIVGGVPVRLRRVDVDVDRPQFAINPTSCSEKRIDATLTSIDGTARRVGSRFQAADCQSLGFKPRMAMRLSGKRQTRTGGHPTFSTTLRQGKGQANIGAVKVTMPASIALDANNSYDPKLVCDYDKAQQADCPASSIIGKATAYTPVLNRPLTGPVHLVQGIKFGPKGNRIRTTPALLVKLRGEVAINLRGQTTTERGTNRLITTFAKVPDAPVSRFDLKVNGGNNGILVVTRTRRAKINLCSANQIAAVETHGQNGKQADFQTRVKTPCAKASSKAAKKRQAAKAKRTHRRS